jgi:hypothetical protein
VSYDLCPMDTTVTERSNCRFTVSLDLKECAPAELHAGQDVNARIEVEVAEIDVPALACCALETLVEECEPRSRANVWRPAPLP